jgi:hypothetical protein
MTRDTAVATNSLKFLLVPARHGLADDDMMIRHQGRKIHRRGACILYYTHLYCILYCFCIFWRRPPVTVAAAASAMAPRVLAVHLALGYKPLLESADYSESVKQDMTYTVGTCTLAYSSPEHYVLPELRRTQKNLSYFHIIERLGPHPPAHPAPAAPVITPSLTRRYSTYSALCLMYSVPSPLHPRYPLPPSPLPDRPTPRTSHRSL